MAFSEAATVLTDDFALTREDPDREPSIKKSAAEPYRDINFSKAKRGPVIKIEPGKTKISIRLDNAVIEHFRSSVEKAGAGNYQTLINDALLAHIQQRNVLDAVRQVVREELSPARARPRLARSRQAVAQVG